MTSLTTRCLAQNRNWSIHTITGLSWIKSYHSDFGLTELYLPFIAFSSAKFTGGLGLKYDFIIRQPFYLYASTDLVFSGIKYAITNTSNQEVNKVNWHQLTLNPSIGAGYELHVSKKIQLSYETNFIAIWNIVGWKGSHETSHFKEILYKPISLAVAGSVNVILNKKLSFGLNFQHFITSYEPGNRSRKNYPIALYLAVGFKI